MNWIVPNLWLIPALPLLAAGITALAKRPQRKVAATLAIGSMGLAFVLSCVAFSQTLAGGSSPEVSRRVYNLNWLQFGDAWLQLGWVLDPLTAVMLLMVTFVGALIFIYSVGYMAHDENYTRFFCFLSLFAAAMLGLVIANSLLLLFVCWELVGLSSYLLIGFWYHKPSAAAAAKKAFIVTRIGDLGFFLGILWLYAKTGTLLFYDDDGNGCLQQSALTRLVAQTTGVGLGVSTAISLLIFCGAIGKSGQVPLHVWLPDAMEGPTPVSALIHAATMVAAGVFLVARVYPLMEATKPISAVAEAAHEPTHSLPLPRAEQASVRAVSVPLLGGVRGGFMIPMGATNGVDALQEPTVWCPGFSRSGPPEGGTPYRWPGPHRFMVPMHAKKRMRTLHEPAVPERGSVTRRTWGCSGALRLTEPRSHRVVGFMDPMLVQILEVGPTREPERRTRVRYGFNARSAAVLGSSNVSTPNTPELYQISAALEPAAPEDGRTPIFTYPVHHGVLCPASGHRAEQEFGAPALWFAGREWVGREQVALPGGEARSSVQHSLKPVSSAIKVVTWVGAITAVFAALIGIAQTDIKRILAYSTVSQLGYMMMGLGVGGVAVGLFHLITHAFFKALLFLGAGSVIHGCQDEQDIRRLGGLRKRMPVTFATYAIGMMALCGLPLFFSGFWSKDEILHAAWFWPSKGPFVLGIVGAFLTAFYMTRQVCYVFFGDYRGRVRENASELPDTGAVPGSRPPPHADPGAQPHESPRVMTAPLGVLAAFSILIGFVGTPAWPGFQDYLGAGHEPVAWTGVLILMLASTLIVFTGVGIAGFIYGVLGTGPTGEQDTLEALFPSVFALLREKFYVDELYEATLVRLNARFSRFCHWLDSFVLDTLVAAISYCVLGLSWVNRLIDEYVVNLGFDEACQRLRQGGGFLSRLQDGQVQHYLRVLGLALTVLLLLLSWGCGK